MCTKSRYILYISLFNQLNDYDIMQVNGNTPVHYAAMGGHCDILRLLLQNGVTELHRNKVKSLLA